MSNIRSDLIRVASAADSHIRHRLLSLARVAYRVTLNDPEEWELPDTPWGRQVSNYLWHAMDSGLAGVERDVSALERRMLDLIKHYNCDNEESRASISLVMRTRLHELGDSITKKVRGIR